jgi:flagellar biosynthesis chaperone FliJ
MTSARPSRPESGSVARTRVIGFSADRTLLREPGASMLRKVYERGTLDQALAEAAAGRQIAGPGVVRYGEARRDPSTGRPAVEVEALEGRDLARVVAEDGPLDPVRTAQIGHAVATTIARLADQGLVHRDLKPGNVFLTDDGSCLLIDAEHALRIGSPDIETERGFSGATHGFAPPEAYTAAPPSPSFDVFGLGVTLLQAATGRRPFFDREGRRLRPDATATLPTRLAELLTAAAATDPSARPTAAQLAADFAAFAEQEVALRGSAIENARTALQQGRFDAVAEALAGAPNDGEDAAWRERIERQCARYRRLVARSRAFDLLPNSDDAATSDEALLESQLPELASIVALEAPRLRAILERFPLHPGARRSRTRAIRAVRHLLANVAPTATRLRREMRFEAAQRLVGDCDRATHAVLAVVDTLRPEDPATTPSAIWRRPHQVLRQLDAEIATDRARHDAILMRLQEAEADLDLERAVTTVDELAEVSGGASEVVGRLKDRVHGLGFYLARLGGLDVEDLRVAAGVAGVTSANDREALLRNEAILTLTDRCRRAARALFTSGEADASSISPRSALRLAAEAVGSFPWIEPALRDGVAALESVLVQTTESAWRLLGDAELRLSTPPTPIRIVRELLEQLDELRISEVLIDRPGRSRTTLLDGIERVRERFEQARSVRDQLARGAQEALQRGHITTALFDMARAVDRFEDATDDARGESERLARQLEDARRHKQEIERRTQANHALAMRYAQLCDATDSPVEERVQTLEDRGRALSFLAASLSGERAAAYARDLRDVVENLLHEHADASERALAALPTGAIAERAARSRETLDRLRATLTEFGHGLDGPGGRIERFLETWQTRTERLEHERATAEMRSARLRKRRLLATVAVVAVLVVAIGIVLAMVFP